jgi:hypothetical protein
MIRRFAIPATIMILIGLVGFGVLSWRPAIAAIEREPGKLHC